jgi:small-conductance mechanosensitive channel
MVPFLIDTSSLLITQNPYIDALFIFVLFILCAKILDMLFGKVLSRLVLKTKTDTDDKIIAVMRKPIFYTVGLVGLLVALSSLEFPQSYETLFPNVLEILLVFIWTLPLITILNILIDDFVARMQRNGKAAIDQEMAPFLKNLVRILFVGIAILIVLARIGVDVTPALASAGIIGFAVAFAAKDTIANVFGGLSVFIDKPYQIGDYVIIDDKHRGEVRHIGLRSTKIKTRDEVMISIPNSIMANSSIVNESGFHPQLRIRVPVGVAYGSDLKKVEAILKDVAIKNRYVVKEPEPRVRFRSFEDSFLRFELLCWIKEPALKGRAIHYLNSEIHDRFLKEGIELPFPQLEVRLKK